MIKEDQKGYLESSLFAKGWNFIGVDEVGRGCLAGPVYAAACVLNWGKLTSLSREQKVFLRDSKTLSAKQRIRAVTLIKRIAECFAIERSSQREVEDLRIVAATHLAMRRALKKIPISFDKILVDGREKILGVSAESQIALIKGDSLAYSIACASILAKEARDAFMKAEAVHFPGYGFETHVGYGTKKHLNALKSLGPCTLHRRNFAPVLSILGSS